MIRQFVGGILAALRDAMLPNTSQRKADVEEPLPPPAAQPLTAVTPTSTEQPALTPPRFEHIASRVPAIDPKLMAQYWREGLNFLNFQELARSDSKQIKPLLQTSLDAITAKAGISAQESGLPPSKAEEEVNVVLCLWQTGRDGQFEEKGLRHPMLSVPAILIEKQWLAPRMNAVPILNERYLAPDIAAGCFGIADKDEANASMLAALATLLEDKSAAPGWALWWQTCVSGLFRLLGGRPDDGASDFARISTLLSALANALLKKPLNWALLAAVYPTSGGGAMAVSDVYDNLAQVLDEYPAETALFRTLCGSSQAQNIATQSGPPLTLLSGHMDEYGDGKRSLFPLDTSQRAAVRAILSLRHGQIQAINGPPGSGKTAMLRAVVASKWVTAALNNAPCPIIVACGATNQSVTNVIDAFGKAPHLDNNLPHAQRWIDHAPSYGAFLPSNSYKTDAKNQAEIAKTVCLEKLEGAQSGGFLYRYFQRLDILNPARALDDEGTYLARGRAALGQPELAGIEDVVKAVWQRLHQTHTEAAHFLAGNGATRQQIGQYYLARHSGLWAVPRKTKGIDLLHQQNQNDAEEQLDAAHQFMDIAWRAEAFHWAARYWEGQFLLAQRTRLLSRHPNNIGAALRRLCMLTPCLVSTLHSVPKFAKIDHKVTDQNETRSHLFGVFDLLVIDEAGQALPEMAGAAFALAKTAAVVGDLKQLAPISGTSPLAEIAVAYRAGASAALDAIVRSRRSIVAGSALGMARLVSRWREADDDGVMLRFHYRCKPSIIDYCNHLCYNATLVARTDETDAFPEPALAWVNIDAEPKTLGGSHCNRDEADAIVEWLVERWPVWQRHKKTAGKPIHDIVAIVTPYKAQSDYLVQCLKEGFGHARSGREEWPSEDDIKKVTIGTVHRLQGAERPIVCFSLVEGVAQAAGSFIDRDATLMNVAVSRAKSSFIIFANPQRLFPAAPPLPGQTLFPVHQLGEHLRKRPEAKLLYPEKLVLIEAGGKLATMQTILGKSCTVLATGGALHRLPLTGGVNIKAGFVPQPVLEDQAAKAIERACSVLHSVDQLVFATDDDRMGEYIAWQARRLLGSAVNGKTVTRVRLGAISATAVTTAFAGAGNEIGSLNDKLILAEAVREVVDCLIAQRFACLQPPIGDADADNKIIAALAHCGACTDAKPGRVNRVGRVQGAVLRMILQQARHTLAGAEQFRIRASVTIEGCELVGHVLNLSAQREITTQKAALTFCTRPALPLKDATMPGIMRESLIAPLPGTIEILAAVWETAQITPWDAMAALQALYDGSWSPHKGVAEPILEPIPAPMPGADTLGGHPPIRPLDRSASPAQLQSVMPGTIHSVYATIWDYYLASECTNVTLSHGSFTWTISETLGVKFEGITVEGMDGSLTWLLFDRNTRQHQGTNSGIFTHWRDMSGTVPHYTPQPLLVWDMTPDRLLRAMADNKIGRPSTFARALQKLQDKGLLAFPAGDGPLRLTPDGLASALALEACEDELSSPEFSGRLSQLLDEIESGTRGPRDVLLDLMPDLTPDHDPEMLAPRIWNSLDELEAAMDQPAQVVALGPMIGRGSGNGDVPNRQADAMGTAVPGRDHTP